MFVHNATDQPTTDVFESHRWFRLTVSNNAPALYAPVGKHVDVTQSDDGVLLVYSDVLVTGADDTSGLCFETDKSHTDHDTDLTYGSYVSGVHEFSREAMCKNEGWQPPVVDQ